MRPAWSTIRLSARAAVTSTVIPHGIDIGAFRRNPHAERSSSRRTSWTTPQHRSGLISRVTESVSAPRPSMTPLRIDWANPAYHWGVAPRQRIERAIAKANVTRRLAIRIEAELLRHAFHAIQEPVGGLGPRSRRRAREPQCARRPARSAPGPRSLNPAIRLCAQGLRDPGRGLRFRHGRPALCARGIDRCRVDGAAIRLPDRPLKNGAVAVPILDLQRSR